VSQQIVIPFIPTLLSICSPSAVARLVVAVVVWVAVHAVAVAGASTDICKEGLEGRSPSFANDNATTAVSIKSGILGIVAAGDDSLPNLVLTGCRKPVSSATFGNHLVSQAATTQPPLGFQIASGNDSLVSAVALAEPKGATMFAMPCGFNDKQSGESLSNESRIGLSHDAFSCNVLWLEPRGVDSTVCGSFHSSLIERQESWSILRLPLLCWSAWLSSKSRVQIPGCSADWQPAGILRTSHLGEYAAQEKVSGLRLSVDSEGMSLQHRQGAVPQQPLLLARNDSFCKFRFPCPKYTSSKKRGAM
jgi:hypothetical protein